MKASDLMIGDWVNVVIFDEPPHPGKIVGIKYNSWENKKFCDWVDVEDWDELDLDDISPIPLTKEILEKNGFVEKEFYSELIVGDFRILCDLHYVCVYHNEHVDLDIPIEYLHELQHAMRICGIEKTIEL